MAPSAMTLKVLLPFQVFAEHTGLSAIVARLVGADQLIILSDIDAVYDADPKAHPQNTFFAWCQRGKNTCCGFLQVFLNGGIQR